jgi:hypothetical protein
VAKVSEAVARIAPATPEYGGDIIVEIDRMEEGCVLLFQAEDGYNDFIGVQEPKIDELIAALQRAKKLLSAGHGVQGDPAAATGEEAHETPGRQSSGRPCEICGRWGHAASECREEEPS